MTHLAKYFGTLEHEYSYRKKVSLSFDTLTYDPSAEIKILVQIEPEQISGLKQNIIQNYWRYDLILAWNEDIIKQCPNAVLFPFGSCWIDIESINIKKQKQISFLTSNKAYLPGHILRQDIYHYLRSHKNINDFDVLNIRTPPRIANKNIIFEKSMYSIIVENVATENYFTEKLIDCFATKTIPIYYGCPNIQKYFDSDGIITFDSIEKLTQILSYLTPEKYYSHSSHIDVNFEKSKQYFDFHQRVKQEINRYIDEQC
jgi:hypothetical protein